MFYVPLDTSDKNISETFIRAANYLRCIEETTPNTTKADTHQ